MATELELYNRALARIAATRIGSLTDSTEERIKAQEAWPIVRDEVLAAHPWNFALARALLFEATKAITGITAANPPVVTSAAHGFANGDRVYIQDVVGMSQVNGQSFLVANQATNTFELQDPDTGLNVDGSSYTAYSSGGTAQVIPKNAWARRYALPSGCLRVVGLVNPATGGPELEGWTVQKGFLVTDVTVTAPIVYIDTIATHAEWDDPMALSAVIWRLAAELAIDLKSDASLAREMHALYRQALADARALDGQEQSPQALEEGDTWLSARG